jgi:single-strand DNA-binding protein
MGFNQTIIVGNIGRDPEMRYTGTGTAVCSFSVGVSESWTDRQTNEKREKTTWFRVSAWGSLGETCAKYLSKGRQVMVVGTVEASAYVNNAGEAAASLELRAKDVRFLGGPGQSSTDAMPDFAPPEDSDAIPF